MTTTLPPVLAGLGDPADSARFRRGLERIGTPLLDGHALLFVHLGPADRVELQHWMGRFPDPPPFERVPGTDLWLLRLDVPPPARFEYRIGVTRGGVTESVLDPHNPNTATDPFGVNSVATGPAYERPDWTIPGAKTPRGEICEIVVPSTVFGGERTHRLHVPAGAVPDEGYDLLIVHDGSDFLDHSSLDAVLDTLAARRMMRPALTVLLDPVERDLEYTANPEHAGHVVDEVVPLVLGEYPVAGVERRAIVGASLGAIATIHITRTYAGSFGGVVLLSPSVVTAHAPGRGELFAPVIEYLAGFDAGPERFVEQAYIAVGSFERLRNDVRAFVPRLHRIGVGVTFEEVPDGHNWENWRDRFAAALETVLPTGRGGRH